MYQKFTSLLIIVVLMLSAIVSSTSAQSGSQNRCPDYTESPRYGEVSLSPGFPNDPYTVNMQSGGSLDISNCSSAPSACVGYVASNPDYRLHLSSDSSLLRFFFLGEGDTTLVINGPTGNWYCDDDSYDTLNPTIDFTPASDGQYDIWVGSFDSSTYHDGTLYVTELGSVNVMTVDDDIPSGVIEPPPSRQIDYPITGIQHVATGWARYTISDTGIIQATLSIGHRSCSGSSRISSTMALFNENENLLWVAPWQTLTVGAGGNVFRGCPNDKEETFFIQTGLPSADIMSRAYEMRVFASRDVSIGIDTREFWEFVGEEVENAARTYIRSQLAS